jgi:hypothetical protein
LTRSGDESGAAAENRRLSVFINTPMARRLWTGLDDEHLASIGFINFGWNALERKFACLIWVAAGWDQDVGELVLASMGNVSLVKLFLNLMKQELKDRPDRRLWTQASETGALYDEIREARNDVVHCFFHCDPTSGIEGHFKTTTRKTTGGTTELKTVAMGKSDIDDLCVAISDCLESIDDLIMKIWLRRRALAAEAADGTASPAPARDAAVHGWSPASFDVRRLRTYPKERARRLAQTAATASAAGTGD